MRISLRVYIIFDQGCAVCGQSNGAIDLLSDRDLIGHSVSTVGTRDTHSNIWIASGLCLTDLKIPRSGNS